ncbi:MAG: ferrous iron transport protein A [Chlorobiales bacterium]|nr:ferrous iron transport protein A [Chlorobiales bacterium]
MKTLSDMHEGITGEITGVVNEGRHKHGHKRGLNHNGEARLREMGFYEGQQITVLQNKGNGPLVVKFQDTRMVLGRGLAMKILIRNNQS